MGIVISDAAAGHTLVDIVVADLARHDFVERAARQNLVAARLLMRSEGWKPAIGIAHLRRNLCPSLLRHTVHCPLGRIGFWSSVQRYHVESVQH